MMPSVLRLLHISDIHFSGFWDGRPLLDVEREVRDRMLQDFSRMRQGLGPMDGILLVGDIANAGDSSEYDKATKFLDTAAQLIGCPADSVVCVPGNHDVDRTFHDQAHGALRHQLRTIPVEQISDKLADLLGDKVTSETLLRPFRAYNTFALRYGCDISGEHPTFPPKTFPLGDTTLQIHGVNTAWVSDSQDQYSLDHLRLVAGMFQMLNIGHDPDVVTMTLGHHPPRWLRDGEALSPWVSKAHLVLTGHEHEAGLRLQGARSLSIASGAVNPSRSEAGWVPAYNVIEIDVDADGQTLEVTVHPRVWQSGVRAEFGNDPVSPGAQHFSIALLPPDEGHFEATDQLPVEAHAIEVPVPESVESSAHSLIYVIMGASPDRRRTVAREMGLLTDITLNGLEKDRELLNRALESQQLSQLAARLVGGSLHD
jgi:hypothetical protein